MLERILCPCCKVKMVAINYRKYGRIYYRNKCSQCYKKKKKPAPAGWLRSGYKKKEKCDRCGFKFKFPDQSIVCHIDNNTDNNDWANLKTVCANCYIEMQHLPQWINTKLAPDY